MADLQLAQYLLLSMLSRGFDKRDATDKRFSENRGHCSKTEVAKLVAKLLMRVFMTHTLDYQDDQRKLVKLDQFNNKFCKIDFFATEKLQMKK